MRYNLPYFHQRDTEMGSVCHSGGAPWINVEVKIEVTTAV